ncbi:MAG TPA: DNA-formamidopyrimidine glycosylase [Halomicronema sp.]
MPELPEVETVCRGLNQLTQGKVIWDGDVLRESTIAHPFPVEVFLTGLKGMRICRWYRRGKYLLAELKAEVSQKTPEITFLESSIPDAESSLLGVHLRMTGQLLVLPQDTPLQKHTRVRLFLPDGQELRFVDQRCFGQMWWVPPQVDAGAIISGLGNLGPEPFSKDFSLEYFTKRLQRTRRPIKTSLLDQTIVAGVGNIYADEALFLAKVSPTKICSNLNVKEVERLRIAIIEVLEKAIAAGGSTIRNYVSVKGVNGNYAGMAWVYNRAGEPCRVCSTKVDKIRLAGRSCHFCPSCQM